MHECERMPSGQGDGNHPDATPEPLALYDMTLPQLEALMRSWEYPPFRARQIYRQIYRAMVEDARGMTDLPMALRERLAAETELDSLRLLRERTTDNDQTRKALFALRGGGGAAVETVLMRYPDRATVCVSTQAGCAMGCTFCATGRLGLLRTLSSGEMIEQVVWAVRQARMGGESSEGNTLPLNVVFMGMGEPFANYDRWWAAVERLHDPQGFDLGARRMTVSTVGLVPGIRRLASEPLPINLAISLHAPDDALRNELVPINRRYPVGEVVQAAHDYTTRTGRRVSFEYVLLEKRNDSPRHAEALAKLLRAFSRKGQALLFHVNLIPWNGVPGASLRRPSRHRVLTFQSVLHDHHIPCTVRVERGGEIAAACGQLAGQAPHNDGS